MDDAECVKGMVELSRSLLLWSRDMSREQSKLKRAVRRET